MVQGKKARANLDKIMKDKGISVTMEIRIIKVMAFLGVTCSCEIWTMRKFKRKSIDAFE